MNAERRSPDRAGAFEAPVDEGAPDPRTANVGIDDERPEPRPAGRKIAPSLQMTSG
jgi:hypothetical protein